MIDDVGRIRQAFAGVPKTDDPDDTGRAVARRRYPPAVVVDSGPLPDPYHDHKATAEVVLPAWVVESVIHRLKRKAETEGQAPTRWDAHDVTRDYVQTMPEFYVDGETNTPLASVVEERVGLAEEDHTDGDG